MGILLIGVWISHRAKAMFTHSDLNNITEAYLERSKCGFWVAELLGTPSNNSKIEIIRENSDNSEVERALFGPHQRKIIGTVAITVKEDPDLREPPSSVAWLRRMAVSQTFHRRGIGSALADVALEHCARTNFRAVELLTTEYHQPARCLYATKGFDLIETNRKSYCAGLFPIAIYRLRAPCILARSHLNA
jgi:GNAT superfamily N-acetyltransferase